MLYLRSTFIKLLKSERYFVQRRTYCDEIKLTGQKLSFSDHGDPLKVVQKVDYAVNFTGGSHDVLVKMIAAPVNPADINIIQGVYPVKPTLPNVPGNEGVAEIVAIGNEVANLSVGDHVVPLINALGTWRTHAIIHDEYLYKIPKELGIAEAATLTVNPCTAYRILLDYVNLKCGDTIIQNGGNSSVGQNVIQLCHAWGINSVNIIRDRPNVEELKTYLKSLGATEVLTEEQLRNTDIFKSGQYNPPTLAFNCVGGKSATGLMRHLSQGSTLVTYGGMSRQPLMVPTGVLIFKDLHVRGFWMTEWHRIHFECAERVEMFENLIAMMTKKEILPPAHAMIPFDNYIEALNNTMTAQGMVGKKFILNFQE